MAFNFSGAMRGLGAGLVSSGALLEKFNERKFEEEQLKIKLDREEHMERARMKHAEDIQVKGFEHAENLQKSGFVHAEEMTGMQIEAANRNADRAHEINLAQLDIQRQEAAANASARASAAANDLARLRYQEKEVNAKIAAYEASTPEAQLKFRQSRADALTKAGFDPETVEAFVTSGELKLRKTDGGEINITGDNVLKAQEVGKAKYDEMGDSEQKRFNVDHGIKGDDKAAGRETMEQMEVLNLLDMAGRTGRNPQASSQPSTKTENLNDLIETVRTGSQASKDRAYAAIQDIVKQTKPGDPNYILVNDANQKATSFMQKQVPTPSGPKALSGGPQRTAESTRKDISTATRIEQLNKVALANKGKPFNQLDIKSQNQISRMVD